MNDDTEVELDARSNLVILGRTIGTFTGWDQGDTAQFVFYGFLPKLMGMKTGDLNVDYESGMFKLYDDDGKETYSADIVTILFPLERDPST